ncbi:hypothetical protein B0H14DRAFT_3436424 [Mycena olivaceomarginata]|nr:hypothetical protein B0H14DRAFT_3436424 [Mycena olivaceomarginata]
MPTAVPGVEAPHRRTRTPHALEASLLENQISAPRRRTRPLLALEASLLENRTSRRSNFRAESRQARAPVPFSRPVPAVAAMARHGDPGRAWTTGAVPGEERITNAASVNMSSPIRYRTCVVIAIATFAFDSGWSYAEEAWIADTYPGWDDKSEAARTSTIPRDAIPHVISWDYDMRILGDLLAFIRPVFRSVR